jgi:hypothetical protein
LSYITINRLGEPQLIDIVNKRPVARAEQGNSAPAAEDTAGTRGGVWALNVARDEECSIVDKVSLVLDRQLRARSGHWFC